MESKLPCRVRPVDAPPARGTSQKARHKAAQESDRDSGYSDVASEGLSSVEQTDSEEGPAAGPRNAKKPLGHTQTPPVVIVQKVLVDQGSGHEPPVESWTLHPSLQLLPSSPQILLFPPAVSPAKPEAANRRTPKYLPILNSYTKIAPHPSHLSAKRGADALRPSQAKRPHSGPTCQKRKSRAASLSPCLTLTDVLGCEAESKGQGGPAPAQTSERDPGVTSYQETDTAEVQPAHTAERQNNSRRFQNTLDVLHRSGLLGIAMRTKELMQLNQITQRQLEQLQQQVELYSRAVSGNEQQDWQRLQDSLAERDTPATGTE